MIKYQARYPLILIRVMALPTLLFMPTYLNRVKPVNLLAQTRQALMSCGVPNQRLTDSMTLGLRTHKLARGTEGMVV
jgi:hypothetical protein